MVQAQIDALRIAPPENKAKVGDWVLLAQSLPISIKLWGGEEFKKKNAGKVFRVDSVSLDPANGGRIFVVGENYKWSIAFGEFSLVDEKDFKALKEKLDKEEREKYANNPRPLKIGDLVKVLNNYDLNWSQMISIEIVGKVWRITKVHSDKTAYINRGNSLEQRNCQLLEGNPAIESGKWYVEKGGKEKFQLKDDPSGPIPFFELDKATMVGENGNSKSIEVRSLLETTPPKPIRSTKYGGPFSLPAVRRAIESFYRLSLLRNNGKSDKTIEYLLGREDEIRSVLNGVADRIEINAKELRILYKPVQVVLPVDRNTWQVKLPAGTYALGRVWAILHGPQHALGSACYSVFFQGEDGMFYHPDTIEGERKNSCYVCYGGFKNPSTSLIKMRMTDLLLNLRMYFEKPSLTTISANHFGSPQEVEEMLKRRIK